MLAVHSMIQYDSFMPRGKPFARIAITLPAEDPAAADRLAAENDRSRSWIVAEAVRRYVRERATLTVGVHLGASRREQLRRDLALSPLERVRAAEEGVRIHSAFCHSAPCHSASHRTLTRLSSFRALLP